MNWQSALRWQFRIGVAMLAALGGLACGGSAIDGPRGGANGGSPSAGGSAGGPGSAAGADNSGGSGQMCGAFCPFVACQGALVTKPGECCPSCASGGSGGVSSGGSDGVCSGGCPAIGCGPGSKLVSEPGACCPTCVPDGFGGQGGSCAGISCPGYACVDGYEPQTEPGACCATCVPKNACAKGRNDYAQLKAHLLTWPRITACEVDEDCTLLAGDARCGDACAQDPVNVSVAANLEQQLSSVAKLECSTCAAIYPPCVAPLPPSCVMGVCVRGRF